MGIYLLRPKKKSFVSRPCVSGKLTLRRCFFFLNLRDRTFTVTMSRNYLTILTLKTRGFLSSVRICKGSEPLWRVVTTP